MYLEDGIRRHDAGRNRKTATARRHRQMSAISVTRRELRLAMDEVLDERGITDPRTRTSLIERCLRDFKVDADAAMRAFVRGVKMAASGSSDDGSVGAPGKVFVSATPAQVFLSAGAAEKELPALDFDDPDDRDTLDALVQQRIRTAQRNGERLSFAAAAEEVMKREFGSGAAENAPARIAAAGGEKKSWADLSPDQQHELTLAGIAAAKKNGETLSYFAAARRCMVRLAA